MFSIILSIQGVYVSINFTSILGNIFNILSILGWIKLVKSPIIDHDLLSASRSVLLVQSLSAAAELVFTPFFSTSLKERQVNSP